MTRIAVRDAGPRVTVSDLHQDGGRGGSLNGLPGSPAYLLGPRGGGGTTRGSGRKVSVSPCASPKGYFSMRIPKDLLNHKLLCSVMDQCNTHPSTPSKAWITSS